MNDTEIVTVRKLKLDPATGEPTIQLENQTRKRSRKSAEAVRRAEQLADLAKANYRGPRRPGEDYIEEATKQVVT